MWKKVLGGLVVLIVVIVGLVFYATSGMTDAAESFFKQVQSKHYDKAYTMLSEDFRRSTTEEQMIAFLKQTGLDSYTGASWGNRSFEGKRGTLEGSITTASGGSVPLTINLIKAEDGSWQIYSMDKPGAGVLIQTETKSPAKEDQVARQTTQAAKPAQKENTEYVDLVKNTLHDFALSINQKSMESFRNGVSKALQESASTETFNNAFKAYIEKEVDLTVLDPMQPIFDKKPQIEDGILAIKGHYDTTPNQFYFDLSYMQENGAWKLTNIDVKVNNNLTAQKE
jgi:hypothetical protein